MGYDCGGWVGIWHSQIPASRSCNLFPFFHHFLYLFLYFHLLIDPCISLLQVEPSSFFAFPSIEVQRYFIRFFPTFSVPSTMLSISPTFSIHRFVRSLHLSSLSQVTIIFIFATLQDKEHHINSHDRFSLIVFSFRCAILIF